MAARDAGAAAGLPADPEDLQRQFAAYLGTPTRARGYPPFEGDNALIVEVAPALAIERVTDLALRAVPEVEPGILYVERQFGVLEVHHADKELVDRAGAAILDGIGATPADAAPSEGPLRRRDRGHHRPARGDHQPQPRSVDGDAGGDPARLRDDARPVRDRRRERGREGRSRRHARERVDDRRGRPRLPERADRQRRAGARRDHAGARGGGGA